MRVNKITENISFVLYRLNPIGKTIWFDMNIFHYFNFLSHTHTRFHMEYIIM